MVIGSISEVRGIKVLAQFYQKLPPHIINNGNIFPAPQINSYVKTNVGLDTIVCQIVGEYLKDGDTSIEHHVVELEVRGRVRKKQFLGGLRLLPIVGAKIETLTEDEFNSIFLKPKYSICIGNSLYDVSNKIYLDVNTLIPSHIGIFGNTGSGKSNTLAKILKEYIRRKSHYKNSLKSKVIVFDLNNEYDGDSICEVNKKKIFRLTTREANPSNDKKIPLNFSKLSYEDCGVILNATEKMQLPVIKKAYENVKEEYPDGAVHYGVDQIKKIIVNKKANVFFAIRQYGADYIKGLENFRFNSTNGDFYYRNEYGSNTYIHSIEDIPIGSIKIDIPTEWLSRFELELIIQIALRTDSGVNFEYISPLMPRMASKKQDLQKVFYNVEDDNFFDDWFDSKSLSVIALANVNKDIRTIVPSLIASIIYDKMVEEKGNSHIKSIINIVIDEAHNLLSTNDEQTELHNDTLKTFEKIVKEGRKYGVYLMLSSQRPSDISNTITSQLHNYFIHKLVNPNDIEKIRKTVSYMGESSLNMVTVLGAGECIISGNSLYMPQYVYVEELVKKNRPNSANATLFGTNGIVCSKKKGK